MTNTFLKVNKDLFKLGLNPTEILILAQIIEFNTTTGDFFKSDKAIADDLGVSDKTISRAMKALEEKGYITRNTKNIKGGKVRHITVNINKIEQKLTTDKMTFDDNSQQTKSPLITDKLTVDNRQNDLIKENIIDNKKENIREVVQPQAAKPTSINEPEEDGSLEHPWIIPKDILAQRVHLLQPLSRGLFMDDNRIFYKMKEYKGE